MFKARYVLTALAAVVLFFCSASLFAQAPAGAPAGSTGLCNDATYYSGATKAGACRGHKGVKTWWGPTTAATAAKPAPAPPVVAKPATPAPPPAPPAAATKPAPTINIGSQSGGAGAGKVTSAPAAGGGPGMVWVNTASKVYHCPTDRYYGKTKAGKYLSETAAQAEGDKPDAGKKCF